MTKKEKKHAYTQGHTKCVGGFRSPVIFSGEFGLETPGMGGLTYICSVGVGDYV